MRCALIPTLLPLLTPSGFMSAADKVKLNGISSGANKYTHPSYTQKAVWPVQGHSRYIWACERGGSGCKG